MIRASVAGASGYSGGEVVRWLARHPAVELVHLTAREQAGAALEQSFPHLRGVVAGRLEEPDWELLGRDSDVVFLALPHGLALVAVPRILEQGARVVDLGADFRLRDPASYRRWYGLDHTQQQLLGEAVYGLPELGRDAIRRARLVANPGCYPTAVALAVAPLLRAFGWRLEGAVVVDAKSGASGAGRKAELQTLYAEVNENVRPYKTGEHRHAPEMEQCLARLDSQGAARRVFFSPHLVPMTRGILAACYLRCAEPPPAEELQAALEEAYAEEPFVRVVPPPALPETKATYGSNLCDVGVRADSEAGVIVAFAALDNLVKGAAGQAIQNMNLMFERPETEGLEAPPLFP